MIVRLAEPADGFAVFDLAKKFYNEFVDTDAFLSFDNEKSAWVVHKAIQNALALVVENDDKELVGALVLDVQQPFYSLDSALWDLSFYVVPEARRSRAAILLRDAAKALAADMRLPLYLGVSSGTDLDRKDRFLIRAGFKRLGSLYRWSA